MVSIYIVHTPYHVLLASVMARDTPSKTELILIQDSNSDYLVEAISAADVFDSVSKLPGLYGKTGFLSRRTILLWNIAWLRVHLWRRSPDTLVVFNDRRQDVQAALHACPDATVIYAEDGSAAYTSTTLTVHDGLGLLVRKIVYGYWYESTPSHGMTTWIDEIRATAPRALRPELQSYPVEEISTRAISKIGTTDWVGEYLDSVGVSKAELSNIDVVIVPNHSSYVNLSTGYVQMYKRILNIISDHNMTVGVKYHPRDNKEVLPTHEHEFVTVFPNEIPFEFISMTTNNVIVIGDSSTALLTAGLGSTTTVYSLAPIVGYDDEQLLQAFERTGVELFYDLDELESALKHELAT